YTQIETEDGSDEESDESDSEVNVETELSKVTEMRIIPSDPCQLDGLFEAFSHCAELNPDPNAESDEENGWAHRDEGD
ncbi:Voldacs domain-containing protein, partial [Shewanella sp. A3A]|nr:Voldacs domain-containing protein [Shewanella ferrihydritica]